MQRFDNMPLLLLFFFFLTTSSSTSHLIESTCNCTMNYAFCISTLVSDSGSFKARTAGDLSAITIRIALSSAVNTSLYFISLAKRTPFDARLGSVLHGCGQRYVNAREALEWGLKAVEDENYDYAAVDVGAGKEYPGMCRGLFKASRLSYPKEVTRRARRLVGLCQVGLDIMSCLLN